MEKYVILVGCSMFELNQGNGKICYIKKENISYINLLFLQAYISYLYCNWIVFLNLFNQYLLIENSFVILS